MGGTILGRTSVAVDCALLVDGAFIDAGRTVRVLFFAAPVPAWVGSAMIAGDTVTREVRVISNSTVTARLGFELPPGRWVVGVAGLEFDRDDGWSVDPEQGKGIVDAIDEFRRRLTVVLTGDPAGGDEVVDWSSGDGSGTGVIAPAPDSPLGRLARGPAHRMIKTLVSDRDLAWREAIDGLRLLRTPPHRPSLTRDAGRRPARAGNDARRPVGDIVSASAFASRLVRPGVRNIEFDVELRFAGDRRAGTDKGQRPTRLSGRVTTVSEEGKRR